MPNDLISTDPLVAQNFFLEIDGEVVTTLSGVSGLDIEMDVATTSRSAPTASSSSSRPGAAPTRCRT